MANSKESIEKEAAEAVGLGKISQSEIDKAKKEGALEAAKEQGKAAFQYATDGNLPSTAGGRLYPGSSEVMGYADLLDLGVDEFKKRIAEDADNPVPEEKVAGLLEVERSGRNRTNYVKALMKRLDIDSPYEVTTAGPAHTNDETPITKL